MPPDLNEDLSVENISQTPVASPSTHEAEARRKGWLPKDEFKDDAGKWVDATTFVERGERFNKNLIKQVDSMKKQMETFKGTQAAFAKFHAESMAKKDTEIADAIKTLRLQKSIAQREGEDESVINIEDRIDSLNKERADLKTASAEVVGEVKSDAAQVDPVLEEWIEDGNDWFKADTKLQAYAVTLGQELISKGETLRGRAFLDKVRSLMEDEFPKKFSNTNRERPGATDGGKSSNPGKGGKTAADLPAEDLALMKQFVTEGWITEKDYLASYFSR